MMDRSGEVMTSPTPNLASSAMGRAEGRDSAASAADAGPFVLNLCSSTTPMALAQTDLAELKRFTFFVSRRFEEGRERFRLHMGYFTTLAEAEEWLNVVREIYPGAWAGEAPGKKLRARAAAAAAEQAQHALGPQSGVVAPSVEVPAQARAGVAKPTPARAPAPNSTPSARAPEPVPARPRTAEAKPSVARAPITAAQTSSQAPGGINVPTVHAATPAVPRVPMVTPLVAKAAPVNVAAPRLGTKPASAAPSTAMRAPGAGQVRAVVPNVSGSPLGVAGIASPHAGSRVQATVSPRQPGGVAPVAQASPKQRPNVGAKPASKGAFADSNVREVLAALDETGETGETRMMPAPVMPRADAQEESTLTDTQVLRYLETRRSDSDERSGRHGEEPTDASISLLKPDDTGTRRALKDAVAHNDPVSFAVQLQWAVQPVELDKVPPLAIFSAYTLYTVEGSREGRKWYGLRLGFFTDAISAKQVAYYVRSEFASVAVVPVSPQEKSRATDADRKSGAGLAFPKKTRQEPVDEFKLIDSDEGGKAGEPGSRMAPRPSAKPAPVAVRSAPQPTAVPKRNPPPRGGGRVGARERRAPQTLEETLEILGAGQLEIDNGTGETLNETGVRHLRVEVQKNTPFSRLLERLSERTKKN
jgi:hypothetical protein